MPVHDRRRAQGPPLPARGLALLPSHLRPPAAPAPLRLGTALRLARRTRNRGGSLLRTLPGRARRGCDGHRAGRLARPARAPIAFHGAGGGRVVALGSSSARLNRATPAADRER